MAMSPRTLIRFSASILIILLITEALARMAWWLGDSDLKEDWRLQYIDAGWVLLGNAKQVQVQEIVDGVDGNTSAYISHDAGLGWTVNANASTEIYKSNSIGARSDNEYPTVPAMDVVRFAAFGDSFTHADHVSNEHTWAAQWESQNSNVEVVNFGVSGFGTDQAYLRYKRKADVIDTDIVLIGILSENIDRNVNTYIPFLRQDSWPAIKPRFILDDGALSLVENTFKNIEDYRQLLDPDTAMIAKLGEHDFWYQSAPKPHWLYHSKLVKLIDAAYRLLRYPSSSQSNMQFNSNSPHFKLLVKIIERFAEDVIESGAHPVVVMFSSNYSYRLPYFLETGLFTHQPLLDYLELAGIDYVDSSRAIYDRERFDLEQQIPGHYSQSGNRFVAEYLNQELAPLIDRLLEEKMARPVH